MSPGLFLHRSNQVEVLGEHLTKVLESSLSDPLQPEIIVVQSQGLRRWLSYLLAGRFGIAMNCEFPYVAEFAQRVFRAGFPERDPQTRAFSRETLLWRVLAALPEFLEQPSFATLRGYLGTDAASELKRYQLARQIGGTFDQYLAFMPEELLRWEAGTAGDWQEQLWRRLAQGREEENPAALLQRLRARGEEGALSLQHFPERVSVFGVASLPPFYLHLLREVSRAAEVHLYLFEPTNHFWGDVQSLPEQERFLRRYGRPGQTAAALHLESGHELLASLGKAGRAFSSAVLELEPNAYADDFREPAGGTLLARVQADILHLREGTRADLPTPDFEDGSVQIHCVHSPMREVEVLYDQLLALLERIPGLQPRDILVTMPNVETHAPFIEAVFGLPDQESSRLPYTVADRAPREENPVARTFLRLLDLAGGRLPAPAVMELLETPAVRERFGLDERDLETVRGWVERTGIRWGIDDAHRAAFGPGFHQNSWRAGLDRLLLGYAWPVEGEDLFQEILPDTGIEGGLAELLGRFVEFTEALFEELPRLEEPRSPAAWSEALAKLLARFFAREGTQEEEVRATGSMLATLMAWEEFHPGPVPFPILRAHLETVLSATDSARGFIAGHLTFCSLKPMRSIPFRVFCVLGLEDGAYPRRDVPVAFDRLPKGGQTAGRSRRDEDRQLFLESLLSARDVFYLSYGGLSTKDNTEAPPSVVVSELLDYLTTLHPQGEEGRRELVTRHRLQSFSPDYFSGRGRLFSYSEELSEALAPGPREAGRTGPCAGPPLPAPEPDRQGLELRDLSFFLSSPPRFFVERCLGARLPSAEGELLPCEPLALNTLDRWQLAQRLAEARLRGRRLEEEMEAIRAAGVLPAGHFGAAEMHEIRAEVEPLLARLENAGLGAPREPETLAVAGGDWRLQGTLTSLHEHGLRLFTPWKLKPKDRLRAWLQHLLLNAAEGAERPGTTVLFATDETLTFAPCPQARERLEELVALYAEGHRRPLPLFAESSYELARRRQAGDEEAEEKARRRYHTDEADLPYHHLCFRHLPTPCGPEWAELSRRVWQPPLLS